MVCKNLVQYLLVINIFVLNFEFQAIESVNSPVKHKVGFYTNHVASHGNVD